MGKLVRDRIPELIERDGRTPRTRVLDDDAYLCALLDKLVEEANELRNAEPGQRIEEMADVVEVLHALQHLLGLGEREVHAAADAKRVERGGFAGRIWLES